LQLPAKVACSADGHFTQITQASLGRIRIPRIPPGGNNHGCLRRSEGTRYHPRSPLKKTVCGTCGKVHSGWYDRKVRRVRDLSCADTRIYLDIEVRRVQCRSCGKVKRERLDFLADNPLYTKRFAWFVGRRCRQSTVKDVARELNLDWHTVKELDKHYMRIQLERAGMPGPHARAEGGRYRRNLDPQRAHVPHRGERSGAQTPDLVRRTRPLGAQHGPVL